MQITEVTLLRGTKLRNGLTLPYNDVYQKARTSGITAIESLVAMNRKSLERKSIGICVLDD